MFEKFTEKAINVITSSQEQAKSMDNAYVQPEHLLIALVKEAKGISLKLFKNANITVEALTSEVDSHLRFEKASKEAVPFSDGFKNLLKNTLDLANKSGNNFVLYEHLLLAVILDKASYNARILRKFDFDSSYAVEILSKLVQRKSKRLEHPEIDDSKEPEKADINSQIFEDESSTAIFEVALEKLKNSQYEVLGTEQIISAILQNRQLEVSRILEENGINTDAFEQQLSVQTSRDSEYDSKKIVFTPSAYEVMNIALQTSKELGEPKIKPEHVVLGLLKSKKGVAYDIIKSLNPNDEELVSNILKPIEKQMPQALTILRLAKQEARRLGRNVVGSEMILLGVLSEGTGIGFKVLNDLEITLKDLRQAVEKILGYGNEYYDKEIIFTKRAKKILEVAWEKANKYHRPRILSEHLLYAITAEPSSVAMKALEYLGVDVVEIKQGIMKEIEG